MEVVPTAVIIGLPEEDPTGVMYQRALLARGVDVSWISMQETLSALQYGDRSLFDLLVRSDKAVDDAVLGDCVVLDERLRKADFAFLVSNRFAELSSVVHSVLTRAGVILPNAPDAVRMANNKWETYCALTQASVSCARSFLVHTKEELAVLQSELLFPLVFKTVDGSRGDDVYFVHTDDSLVKTFELFHDQGQPVLVQHYIECGAADKRIIVVEGKVITAMTRRGQGGDFRSNLAQGGIAESTEISDGEAELALRVARALGLRFAGLDIATVEEVLPGREYLGLGQPFCLEANAMPALDMPLVYGGVDGSALLVDSMLHQHEHADSVFV